MSRVCPGSPRVFLPVQYCKVPVQYCTVVSRREAVAHHGSHIAFVHGTSCNSAVDAYASDEAHAAACPRADFAFIVCGAPRRFVLVWRLGTMFDYAAESQAAC